MAGPTGRLQSLCGWEITISTSVHDKHKAVNGMTSLDELACMQTGSHLPPDSQRVRKLRSKDLIDAPRAFSGRSTTAPDLMESHHFFFHHSSAVRAVSLDSFPQRSSLHQSA
jgi:hypothetical protein